VFDAINGKPASPIDEPGLSGAQEGIQVAALVLGSRWGLLDIGQEMSNRFFRACSISPQEALGSPLRPADDVDTWNLRAHSRVEHPALKVGDDPLIFVEGKIIHANAPIPVGPENESGPQQLWLLCAP
jgi:hypothetical protein